MITPTHIYFGKRGAVTAKFPALEIKSPGTFVLVWRSPKGRMHDGGAGYTPDCIRWMLKHYQCVYPDAEAIPVTITQRNRVRVEKSPRVRIRT